jgi:hypothetical protein
MFEVAQIVGEMPRRSKCAAGDHLGYAVLLLRELADHEVVLVVAGHCEHEVRRPLDPRPFENEQLGRVTAMNDVLELCLERLEPIGPLLDQRHFVTGAQKQARQVRSDLAAAGDEDVHQLTSAFAGTSHERTASVSTSIAVSVGHTIRRPRSR